MNRCRPLTLIVMLMAVGACRPGVEQPGSATSVPIRIVHRDQHCPGDSASIEVIKDSAALGQWWQPFARQRFPARPLPQSLATIDFARSSAIVVYLGSRPTAGYDIELYSDRASVQKTSLTIPAQWREPPAGSLAAEVMTSPCVVMTLPAGRYETVTVRDRQGRELLVSRF